MNKAIEKNLDDLGLLYEYADSVNISDIDIKQSKVNQARIMEQVNEDIVSFYTASLQAGDIFPPIILVKIDGKYKFICADGNHRISSALKAGMNQWIHGAYIVESCTDEQRRLLAYSVNLNHGLPASKNDRILHAMWLTEQYGTTIKDASEQMRVNKSAVQEAIRYKKAYARATLNGCEPKGINKSALLKINIIQDDKIYSELVSFFKKNPKLDKVQDVVNIVDNIISEGTYIKQINAINELKDKFKKKGTVGDVVREKMRQKRKKLISAKNYISGFNLNDFNTDSKLREECSAILLAISDTAMKKAD